MYTEPTEESCRHFLESDARPEEKAHFCLTAGQRMEQCGDYEAAAACYSVAFALTPENNDVWYFLHNNLGYCLNHFGKYHDAEAYCRQAILINPSRHNAHKNLGISLAGQKDNVAAARQLLKAAALEPDDPRALSHLEVLVQEHPEITSAIPDIHIEIERCRDLERASQSARINIAELKLTAALYTQQRGVLDHVRTTGRLPETIDNDGANVALVGLIERRGMDITLTVDEQVVYDAMLREMRLPGGKVVLVESDEDPSASKENL